MLYERLERGIVDSLKHISKDILVRDLMARTFPGVPGVPRILLERRRTGTILMIECCVRMAFWLLMVYGGEVVLRVWIFVVFGVYLSDRVELSGPTFPSQLPALQPCGGRNDVQHPIPHPFSVIEFENNSMF